MLRHRLGSSWVLSELKRITTMFNTNTINSSTNAAAYAFSCAFPSPAGEFKST